MMDQCCVESTRDKYNYGQYINQLHRPPPHPEYDNGNTDAEENMVI